MISILKHSVLAAALVVIAMMVSPMLKYRPNLRDIFMHEGIHLNLRSIDDGKQTIVVVTASNPG